jgi:hypothetical protein
MPRALIGRTAILDQVIGILGHVIYRRLHNRRRQAFTRLLPEIVTLTPTPYVGPRRVGELVQGLATNREATSI